MEYRHLQQINISLSSSDEIFTAYISHVNSDTLYGAELLVKVPEQEALIYIGLMRDHADFLEAFSDICDRILIYTKSLKLNKIQSIDSPCNAPFISKVDQMLVLSRYGSNIEPTINGV